MNRQTLAKINTLIGILGGVILFTSPIFFTKDNSNISSLLNALSSNMMTLVAIPISFSTLVLGITSLIYFDTEEGFSSNSSVMLILGGVLALFPVLNIIGGVALIIAGVSNFKIIKKIN